ALALLYQRSLADKIFLIEMNHSSEAQFVRRVSLLRDQGLLAADVVNLNEKQAGLNAGNVEREHAGGVDIKLPPGIHERVPDLHGFIPGNPDLVAEVAGVAGAGDVDRHAGDLAAGYAEIFQVGDVSLRDRLKQPARRGSLERQGRSFFRDVFNADVHVEAV